MNTFFQRALYLVVTVYPDIGRSIRRIICLITLSLAALSNCYAQSGWFWQNPYPVGSHIKDCFFVNGYTGYACGDNGSILKTSNGGINWIQLNSGCNYFLTSVFFTNQFTGYITSGNINLPTASTILKTSNGGANWNEIYTFPNTHLSAITFYNDTLGYAVGGKYWWGSRIFKTTNAGNNWIQYPDLPTGFINSICFTGSDTTYIAGDGGVIMKTTNQGTNWIILNTGSNNSTIYNSIYFTTTSTGFAAGNGGRIYKTTNMGIDWVLLNSGTLGGFAEITFANMNTGFACGWGRVFKTTNAGNTWDSLNTMCTENLLTIKSIDSNSVVSCGYNGTVIKSSNNGLSWSYMSSSITSLTINSSYMFDSLNYYIICDSSKILHTFDGGSSWFSNFVEGNYSLKAICFTNQNTGFISGGYSVYSPPFTTIYYAKIFKTTNSGTNWFLVYGLNQERNIIYDIKFLNSLTGVAVGGTSSFSASNSVILKTTNGGTNWLIKYNGGNSGIYSIFIKDALLGFCCGEGGKIFKTSDGGETWSLLNTAISISLNSITFPTNNIGFAAGAGTIIKTTNSGLNWFSYNAGVSYGFDIRSIYFANINTGIAVGISFPDYGRSGDIVSTTNGGTTWNHLSSFSSYPTYLYRGLTSVNFLNNKGIILGEIGTILKTTNGMGIIGIQPINSQTPYNFFLSQNYPNPFNPQTKIKFDIPANVKGQTSIVKLVIYDLLGREVSTLVNEELKPGTYEADWDGSNFSSGVYFYKIISGDFIETKKMVLMK